jgi:hypothetical protein
MSYKKIFSDKIPRIDYFLHQNDVYFKEGNNVVKIDEFLNRKIFFTKQNPFIIESIIDNKLCIRDKASLTYIELKSGTLSKTIPLHFQNSVQIKYQEDNFIIIRNQIDENVWKVFCINNIGDIIWENNDSKPFLAYGVYNKYLIYLFLESKKIAMNNIDNDLVIWEVTFVALTKSSVIYPYLELLESNRKLFFMLGSENRGGVFCVNTKNGEEIALYKGCFSFLLKDDNFIYSSRHENIFCKINSSTDNVEEWDVNQLLKNNGFDNIHDNRCAVHDGLFYFTQTLGDNKSKFGILDTDKKQLVYKYEFEPKNGGIGRIQVSESRIFITTQDNTLHIFEKEKN